MSEWTEERIDQLKLLHKAGNSASQIASKIGGVSRSAVLGKVHRLGLAAVAKPRVPVKARAKSVPTMKAPPKPKATAPVLDPRELPVNIESIARPAPLLKRIRDDDWDGAHECRWPVKGEKENTRFCCHPVSGESSYCEYHRRAARGHGTESERRVAPMPVKRVA